MRITLVTQSMYPDSIGGREKYVYYLADALGKRGHKVKVFTCMETFQTKIKKYKNFSVYYFPSFDIPLKPALYRIPVLMLAKLLNDDADVIHAHDLHHLTTFECALIAKLKNKPLIVTEHGYPPLEGLTGFLIKVYDKTLLRLIKKNSSKIIGVSNFISGELHSRYNVDPKKILTVHNALDTNDFTDHNYEFRRKYHLQKKRIILGVGRLTKEKGFQHLIHAFKKISREYPDTILVIIGPYRGYKIALDKLVKRLGLNQKVIFTGPLEDKMVKSALNCCEMVVIPSKYEPFGLVALEAMNFKKPVIASSIGGLTEILTDGVNSLLVEPGDYREIEEKMEMLLEDKNVKYSLTKNSNDALQKFNWKSFIEKMEKIYEEVANN